MTALQTAASELVETINAYADLMPPALATKLGVLSLNVSDALVCEKAGRAPPAYLTERAAGKPFLRIIDGGRHV